VPIYGYRCANCGHQFEIQQRMSDEPLKACPKCQGKLNKILYPTGVIFKGSGFYSTDYKAADKGASTNGSAPEAKPETKSDKPESKPESKSDSSD
jgi:putative FmdB family regulatory protein